MKTESQNNKKKGLNIYEKRWLAAKKFFEWFKKQIEAAGGDYFTYNGERHSIDSLIIDENEIYILETDGGSRYIINLFENNREYDHGLYTPIKEYQEEFLSEIKIFKEIKVKLKNKRVRKECR